MKLLRRLCGSRGRTRVVSSSAEMPLAPDTTGLHGTTGTGGDKHTSVDSSTSLVPFESPTPETHVVTGRPYQGALRRVPSHDHTRERHGDPSVSVKVNRDLHNLRRGSTFF